MRLIIAVLPKEIECRRAFFTKDDDGDNNNFPECSVEFWLTSIGCISMLLKACLEGTTQGTTAGTSKLRVNRTL
jgi:hypothetical protein